MNHIELHNDMYDAFTTEQFEKAQKILDEINSLRGLYVRVHFSTTEYNLNAMHLGKEANDEFIGLLSKRVEDRINILNAELAAL